MGAGRPQDVPQDFREEFRVERHRIDQYAPGEDFNESDVSDDYGYDCSDEDPDDVVEYDTEHSRYSTVSDRERRYRRARRQVNRRAR